MMIRFTELWRVKKTTLSFEFYPPRTEKAEVKLYEAVGQLASLKPDFVSVTFGAGGSSRDGSFQLAARLSQQYRLNVLAYLAGLGLTPDEICSILQDYRELGIESILCVRGDMPVGDPDFSKRPMFFPHAWQLVAFVKEKFNFILGVAGYPEGHKEAESREKDLAYLADKVNKGADYIITQYFYDNTYFHQFKEKCRQMGILVPIVAGIMPIYSVKMLESLASQCGATIAPEVRQGLAQIDPEDKAAVEEFGIGFALKQCRQLIAQEVDGLHFYTMDRSQSVFHVVRQLQQEGLLS